MTVLASTKDRPRPICEHCSRNARTVDNPHVRCRVQLALVLRPFPLSEPCTFDVIVHCHGDTQRIRLEWAGAMLVTEHDIENLSAFQKART